jgi:hypothetical protein
MTSSEGLGGQLVAGASIQLIDDPLVSARREPLVHGSEGLVAQASGQQQDGQ